MPRRSKLHGIFFQTPATTGWESCRNGSENVSDNHWTENELMFQMTVWNSHTERIEIQLIYGCKVHLVTSIATASNVEGINRWRRNQAVIRDYASFFVDSEQLDHTLWGLLVIIQQQYMLRRLVNAQRGLPFDLSTMERVTTPIKVTLFIQQANGGM